MPRRCVIPNCASNSKHYTKTTKETYVSTFLFPSNEQKLKLWLELINTACNSEITEVTKCSGICMKHFEEQYVLTEVSATRSDGTVLTVPLKRPRLTADAVPTIFLEERDFVVTQEAKRKSAKDRNKRASMNKKEEIKETTPAATPQIKVVPLSNLKKPVRPKTFNVSGTYIIRAEVIRSGPRLIFNESVSRIEKQKQETQHTTLKQEAEDVDDDLESIIDE